MEDAVQSEEDEEQEEEEEQTETEEEEKEEKGHDDSHAKLIHELKVFQDWGLMNEQDPNKVSSSSSSSSSFSNGDELEVTRRYPNFFSLIPQNPHYQGLLLHDDDGGVDEQIKKTVYEALWCRLVDLMDKALRTNCLSNPREVKAMMEEARGLEKLGFDVRHLTARLEQPSRSIFDLSLANDQLHSARKRKHEMEEQLAELDVLEAEADQLKKTLSGAEARVARLRAEVGSNEDRAALMKSLRKQVEHAEEVFRAKLEIFKSLD